MESSRIPFITAHQLARPPQRVLKEWRPRSTRPWTLLLFLTATAVCFGLMMAVSLAEKQTTLNTKRHLHGRHARRDVFPRQDESSTVTEIKTPLDSEVLSLTTTFVNSSEVPSTTVTLSATTDQLSLVSVDPTSITDSSTISTSASTNSHIASTLVSSLSSEELSLTSQCTIYVTLTETVYTATVGSGTPVYPTTSTPASSYTGTCIAKTEYITEDMILSLTSQSAMSAAKIKSTTPVATESSYLSLTSTYLSLTTDTRVAVSSVESPPPATQTVTSEQLSLTSEQASITSQQLSLTTETAAFTAIASDAGTSILSLSSGEQTLNMVGTTISKSSTTANLLPTSSTSVALTLTTQDLQFTSPDESPSTQDLQPSASQSASSSIILVYFTTTNADGQSVETSSYFYTNVEISSFGPSIMPSALTTLSYLTTQTDANGQPMSTYEATIISSGISQIPSATTMSGVVSMVSGAAATTTSKSNSVDPEVTEQLVLVKIKSFPNWYYFIIVYLPKIVAVIMACLWSIIFAGLKLMEPMYQLSAHAGALAEDTMFGNYLAGGFGFASLSATLQGQWVLILSAISLGAWAIVVALISEAMIVISTGNCIGSDGHTFRCNPAWAVSMPVLKVLLALLSLIFMLTASVTYIIIRRKRTGCFVDPSSLAAMAELLGNPAVMHDFREIDPSATESEVRRILGDNRYKLGFYDIVTGKQVHPGSIEPCEQRWGLVKIAGNVVPKQLGAGGQTKYGAVANPGIRTTTEASANKRRRTYQLMFDAVMLLTALTIFALVLAYYLDAKSDPLNDFFNGMGFGPKFVLTSLALILCAGWRQTSQEITLFAPYRKMARAFQVRCGVSAERSILAATACTPFTAFYKGFLLRDYMISAVAMSAILSEVLLVAVSGVPFFAGQIKPSLQASAFASLAILFIMAVTSVAVIIHNRRSAGGARKIPRDPDTLVAVWLYLCGSELIEHNKFGSDEPETIALDQQALTMKYSGGRYAFARTSGADGVLRWTVDEVDELRSSRPESLQTDFFKSEVLKPELPQPDTPPRRQQQQQQQTPFQLRWPLSQGNRQSYTPSLYSVDSDAHQTSYHPTYEPSSVYSDNCNAYDSGRPRPSEFPPQPERRQRPLPQDHFIPPTPRPTRFEVPARGSTPPIRTRFESLKIHNNNTPGMAWTTQAYGTPEAHHQPHAYPTPAQQSHMSQQGQYYYRPSQPTSPMNERSRRTGRAADPYKHTQYRRVDM